MEPVRESMMFSVTFQVLSVCALFAVSSAFLFGNLWWLGIPIGIYLSLKALYYEPKE